MTKQNQGKGAKQKISLAPVKSLSQVSAGSETAVSAVVAPKPVSAVPVAAGTSPAPVTQPVAVTVPRAAPVTEKTPASARPAEQAPAAVAALTPVKPAAAKAAPAPASANRRPEPVAAPKSGKAASAPAMSFAIIPMHPGLTDFDAETWLAPAVSAFRTFAAVQVKALDHACAELQAAFAEAEALARVASPSEAVALQTKAFSRRMHAGSAHFADLAMTARKTGKAA